MEDAKRSGPGRGRALLAGTVGLFADPSREVWRVEGRGAVRALHGLLTNDLEGPPPGARISALALTPKGRPLADVQVWKRETDLLLDLPRVAAASLRDHLARYLPPRLARATDEAGAVVARLLGPRAENALRSAGVRPAEAGSLLAAPRTEEEGGGFDLLRLDPAEDGTWGRLVAAVEAEGGAELTREAYEAWRVECGIPVFGRDFDEESLPQETGLVGRTVSFEKGCYTGQEVVARIHHRGHVNRHLRGLRLPAESAAEEGAPLFRGGREVGRLSSPVLSPRLGCIALAMLRREVEPGALVALSAEAEPDVRVVALPFTFS